MEKVKKKRDRERERERERERGRYKLWKHTFAKYYLNNVIVSIVGYCLWECYFLSFSLSFYVFVVIFVVFFLSFPELIKFCTVFNLWYCSFKYCFRKENQKIIQYQALRERK